MARQETRRGEAAPSPREPQDIRDVIAANLRAAQAEKGIETVDELARLAEISVRLVQKHRAGDNAPGLANLARYSEVLEKPISWFFERHAEKAAA